ncbi:syntaxin-23-like, partial [Camellia sinensis]|uniref:syntaxin-23-like n=1 Tax=Camellia sinensis TaxID=4442 RepID=UPI0010368C0B
QASKKIADAKLAKDFQAVLREFQKAQRLAAKRETTYAPFVPKEVLLPSNNGNELKIDSAKSHEQLALLVQSKRQEVAMLENDIVFNEYIIEEREQGIEEIQQQIGEVNEIFKDLAVLVHEQGVMIDDISSNIESSHAGTAQATCHFIYGFIAIYPWIYNFLTITRGHCFYTSIRIYSGSNKLIWLFMYYVWI